jgi:hypothetical protein
MHSSWSRLTPDNFQEKKTLLLWPEFFLPSSPALLSRMVSLHLRRGLSVECSNYSSLSLAPFLPRFEGADVPSLILGMDGAEPPPADTAVECCGGIAGLIHGRNGLTRPLEVAGFCLIRLFQHIPSSLRAVYICPRSECPLYLRPCTHCAGRHVRGSTLGQAYRPYLRLRCV